MTKCITFTAKLLINVSLPEIPHKYALRTYFFKWKQKNQERISTFHLFIFSQASERNIKSKVKCFMTGRVCPGLIIRNLTQTNENRQSSAPFREREPRRQIFHSPILLLSQTREIFVSSWSGFLKTSKPLPKISINFSKSSECCWNCLRIFWRPLKTYNLRVTASPFRGEILQLKVKTTVLPFFYIRNNFKKYFFSRTYGKFCVSRESKVNPQRCHQMSTLWDHPRLPVPLQFEAVYIWECSRHINRIFASFWLSSNVSASEHWRNKCSLSAKNNIIMQIHGIDKHTLRIISVQSLHATCTFHYVLITFPTLPLTGCFVFVFVFFA